MSIHTPLSPLPPPTSGQDEKESLVENDAPIESNACNEDVTKEEKKTFDLQPVSPYSSGEGLPYAPEGWPNPGDVWSWKVGRRANRAGYFHDRFLSLPTSLQTSSFKTLHSKLHVKRYLESNFPDMEIDEFFALFSWQVPSAEQQTPTKAVQSSPPVTPQVKKSPKTGEVISTKRKLKPKTQICCSQPTRKSSRLVHAHPRQHDQDANIVIDLSEGVSDSEEGSVMQQTAAEEKPNVDDDDNAGILEDMLDDVLRTKTTPSESDHMAPSTTTPVETNNEDNAEDKSLALAIQEIDDQIQELESKRDKVSSALETMYKNKAELTSRLTNVANSTPTMPARV